MTVGANTYGAVAGIQRLIGDIVESRTFTTGTVPTLAQVETELDNAAAELNNALDQAGFTVPVNATDYPTARAFLKAANEYGAAAVLLSTVPSEGYQPDEEVEDPGDNQGGNLFEQVQVRAEGDSRIPDTGRNAGRPVVQGLRRFPGRRGRERKETHIYARNGRISWQPRRMFKRPIRRRRIGGRYVTDNR